MRAFRLSYRQPFVIAAIVCSLAIAASYPPASAADQQPAGMLACRTTSAAQPGAPSIPIRWVTPTADAERAPLDRWCDAVGPVVLKRVADTAVPATLDQLVVISWNVHVGGGDIGAVVNRLRDGAFTGGRPVTHFVLLLQEAHRADASVPRLFRLAAEIPRAILPTTAGRPRQDIEDVATRLQLHLYYAPSMRNGGPSISSEDRGNAILSSLPLSELTAIELPFERQRRVAVAASVGGHATDGRSWSFMLASVHLDNLVGLKNAWIFGGPARQRQARGLLESLPPERPTIVGGDLNSWFGYRDPAYLELARAFPKTPTEDTRPTFGGLLRLDHLFVRLPDGWSAQVRRLDDRFGSDHYPLLAVLDNHPASEPHATRLTGS